MTEPHLTSAGGWHIHRFAQIDSTNRWLAERAAAGAPDRTVAIADEQIAGRGRLGRTWTAPPGSALLMSALVRPTDAWPIDRWHLLTFAIAEAAREAIARHGCDAVSLKWPNDLVAARADGAEGKLAGVLAEAVHGPAPGAVVGMGINVRHPVDVPDDVAARGVWLDDLGVIVDPADLAAAVLPRFGALVEGGPSAAVDAARRSCSTIGRDVRVELPAGEIEGRAVGLTDDGALLVDDGTTVHALLVGDVVHLRAR